MEVVVRNSLTNDAEMMQLLKNEKFAAFKQRVRDEFCINNNFSLIFEGNMLESLEELAGISGGEEIVIEPSNEIQASTLLRNAGYDLTSSGMTQCIDRYDRDNIGHFVASVDFMFANMLMRCCANGFAYGASVLLSMKNRKSFTAVQEAAFVNKAAGCGTSTAHETVAVLFKAGFDASCKSERNNEPIHLAAATGTPETVKLLLDNKYNGLHHNKYGEDCPLSAAISKKNIPVRDLLFEHCPHSCGKGLMRAAEVGDAASARKFLDLGTNPNTKRWRDTPLQVACRNGCLETVKILVEYGSNIHVRSNEGLTLIQECTRLRNTEVQQLLYDLR
eukprot:TRINITY_DN20438_c2_g1_i1.p1 TRINITY_DN20438_c2_g1~~TRINITY_DN20438_c2_g1_i1.p1  ORF type:complete len:333 (+),score=48.25 TRINITY_DN20438_c2_g1_i1:55-1053(+)